MDKSTIFHDDEESRQRLDFCIFVATSLNAESFGDRVNWPPIDCSACLCGSYNIPNVGYEEHTISTSIRSTKAWR